MTVVTISRGSKSMGEAVAKGVAESLGYECLSREVLLEASEQYGIPVGEIAKAMEDAPTLLDRLGHRKHKYVARVRCALIKHIARDNIVYHGHAGHVLLGNLTHVLKIRILARMDLRVRAIVTQRHVSEAEAAGHIERLDRGRRRWTKSLYGVEPEDPSLYDLVLNVSRFGVDDAVKLICESAKMEQFAITADSKRALDDLLVACDVKVALVDEFPEVLVRCRGGSITAYCSMTERQSRKVRDELARLSASLDGIESVEVHVDMSPPPDAV